MNNEWLCGLTPLQKEDALMMERHFKELGVAVPYGLILEKVGQPNSEQVPEVSDTTEADSSNADGKQKEEIKCSKCGKSFAMPKGFLGTIRCEDCDPFMAKRENLEDWKERLSSEWERQKGLFPELSKDGWMDLAIKETKLEIGKLETEIKEWKSVRNSFSELNNRLSRDLVTALERIKELEAENEQYYKPIFDFLEVPQVIRDNPTILKGKPPAEPDFLWAKLEIEKQENK